MAFFDLIHPERAAKSIYSIAASIRDGDATFRGNVERLHKTEERTFLADIDQSLSSEESVSWHLSNPSSNDLTFRIYYGEFTHQDDLSVTLHTSVENVTTDSALESSNNFIGSEVSSNAVSEIVSSFDSLDTHFTQDYFGSETEMVFDGYRISLAPDEEVILEMENLGGNNSIGARIAWAENDVIEVDS